MSERNTFTEFICRIRAGDERAAEELVRRYESAIRREVRLHLEDPRLSRCFDSMDICQSVLASFFVRTAAGQYDLQRPEDLLKLLVTMARNKLASAARREHRQRRHPGRLAETQERLESVVDPAPSPSQLVAGRELLERFRRSLSDEERELAELRNQGQSWEEIATRLGGTAKARGMQLSRAIDRVSRQLGLDDKDDE